MKHITIILSLLFIMGCTDMSLKKNAIFVSPQGDDGWSGRLSEPNGEHSDGPFATLERARDELRRILVTITRLFGHRLGNDSGQLGGDIGVQDTRRR